MQKSSHPGNSRYRGPYSLIQETFHFFQKKTTLVLPEHGVCA